MARGSSAKLLGQFAWSSQCSQSLPRTACSAAAGASLETVHKGGKTWQRNERPELPSVEIAADFAHVAGRLDAALGSTVGLLADRHSQSMLLRPSWRATRETSGSGWDWIARGFLPQARLGAAQLGRWARLQPCGMRAGPLQAVLDTAVLASPWAGASIGARLGGERGSTGGLPRNATRWVWVDSSLAWVSPGMPGKRGRRIVVQAPVGDRQVQVQGGASTGDDQDGDLQSGDSPHSLWTDPPERDGPAGLVPRGVDGTSRAGAGRPPLLWGQELGGREGALALERPGGVGLGELMGLTPSGGGARNARSCLGALDPRGDEWAGAVWVWVAGWEQLPEGLRGGDGGQTDAGHVPGTGRGLGGGKWRSVSCSAVQAALQKPARRTAAMHGLSRPLGCAVRGSSAFAAVPWDARVFASGLHGAADEVWPRPCDASSSLEMQPDRGHVQEDRAVPGGALDLRYELCSAGAGAGQEQAEAVPRAPSVARGWERENQQVVAHRWAEGIRPTGGLVDAVQATASYGAGEKPVRVQLEWQLGPMLELLASDLQVRFEAERLLGAGGGGAEGGRNTSAASPCGRVVAIDWQLPRREDGGVSSGWLLLDLDLNPGMGLDGARGASKRVTCSAAIRLPVRLPVRASEWLPADLHRGVDLAPVRVSWGEAHANRGAAPAPRWHGQLHLPPLQVEPPAPDTAMPYNIATVVSLLCAVAAASIVTAGGRGPRPPPKLPSDSDGGRR